MRNDSYSYHSQNIEIVAISFTISRTFGEGAGVLLRRVGLNNENITLLVSPQQNTDFKTLAH